MTPDVQFHPEKIAPTAYVAPNATVVGDVTLGDESSLWFGVIARGDVDAIVIGPQTNVQDGVILHAAVGLPCRLGARVTVGHGAVVHAATVEDDVLVGTRATVLDAACIGRGSLVAAGTLIPPGMVVPPGVVVMGAPGKVVRAVTAQDEELIRVSAQHYCDYARRYREAGPRTG
jgi:carbonic anhydrase/acetyltransferase-like protein (isoleucine patch superfamily)